MANTNNTNKEAMMNEVITEATKPEETTVQQDVNVEANQEKLILSDEEVKLIMQHREEEAKKADKKGFKITKKKVFGGLVAAGAIIGAVVLGRATKGDPEVAEDNNNYSPYPMGLPDNCCGGTEEYHDDYVEEAKPTDEEF